MLWDLVLARLPVSAPHELVTIHSQTDLTSSPQQVSIPDYEDIREASVSFQAVEATSSMSIQLQVGDTLETVSSVLVSSGYFELLGVHPALGHAPREDGAPTVVVSDSLWKRLFAGSPAVLGTQVRANGVLATIVGVAPAEFRGLEIASEADKVWLPLSAMPELRAQRRGVEDRLLYDRSTPSLSLVGRLSHQVTVDQANAELEVLAESLEAAFPSSNSNKRLFARPLEETSRVHGSNVRGLFLLAAAAGLILLLAGANVVSLLLERGTKRQRELAIRASLGAGRWQLVRLLFVESAAIAVAAAGLGVLLGVLGRRGLWSMRHPLMESSTIDFNFGWALLGPALALTMATLALVGTIPALRFSKPGSRSFLATARSSSPGRVRGQRALVTVQIAVATVVTWATLLTVASLDRILAIDPGFDPDGLALLGVDLDAAGMSPERGQQFYREAIQIASTHPAVSGAAAARTFFGMSVVAGIANDDGFREGETSPAHINWVTPDYFSTMGIGLERGRLLEDRDREGAPSVVVVNQTLADRMWPGQSPLGQRLYFIDRFHEVVGVVADSKTRDLREEVPAFAYESLWQRYEPRASIHIRTTDESAVVELSETLLRLAPGMPIRASSIEHMIEVSTWAERTASRILAAFAALALVLGALGIYGMVAFAMTARTHEFGIRTALGAKAGDILGIVAGEGLGPALGGFVLGAAAIGISGRWIRSMIYETSPLDWPTAALTAASLLASLVLACTVPAWRALAVSPAASLRADE